jgi:hypothetical protein
MWFRYDLRIEKLEDRREYIDLESRLSKLDFYLFLFFEIAIEIDIAIVTTFTLKKYKHVCTNSKIEFSRGKYSCLSRKLRINER